MKNQSSSSDTSFGNDPLSPQRQPLSAEALLRRRLMLKGASSGVAAVAALKPIGVLATQATVLTCLNAQSQQTLCSVSGVQSAAHSFGPNVTTILAKGYTMAHWSANDGKGKPNNAWPTSCASTCAPGKPVNALLAGCQNGTMSMLDVLATKSTTIEADYLCAYLNATAMWSATPTTAMCFPYSPAEVLAFWNNGGANLTKAQTLFKAIATVA